MAVIISFCFAIEDTAFMSVIFSRGFDGVSMNITFVLSLTAFSISSAEFETKVYSIPNLLNSLCTKIQRVFEMLYVHFPLS